MTDNIIPFPEQEKDFEYCGYAEYGDQIGVAMRDWSLQFVPLNSREILVRLCDNDLIFRREELAELLWAAAFLLDSQEEQLAEEYVGLDYPEGDDSA